jgi:ABC-2 type transport system permease protein
MMQTVAAEFRKLLTIRSTYVVTIFVLLLIGFISFYGVGFKGGPTYTPNTLQETILNSTMVAGMFVTVMSILHICHEYRYNTITYSLTISNSRLKVLIAKLVTVSALAVVVGFLMSLIALSLPGLGAAMAGHSLGPQTVEGGEVAWRVLSFMVSSAWLGLILGFLVRSVVAAIAIYFLLPAVESLIQSLLKVSGNYLPASVQMQILQTPGPDMFSPLASLGMFAVYLAVGLVAASILFVRRDAMS